MAVTARNDLSGQQLGQIHLDTKLGQGGMGTVYKGWHMGLDLEVAVKVLPRFLSENDEFIHRFYREARQAARLDHPNIVRVLDVNSIGDVHFIVLQFIDGPDLGGVVNQRGPLPPAEASLYVAQALSGLEYAHQRRIVHRDIKPDNLMLTPEGAVKITDFGLARGEGNDVSLTRTGQAMGTPHYMPIEQWDGAADIDNRADVYSMGVTLYYLLAGKTPVGGSTPTAIVRQLALNERTPLLTAAPSVPDDLAAIVEKMMALQRDDRHQSAAEALDDLVAWRHTHALDSMGIVPVMPMGPGSGRQSAAPPPPVMPTYPAPDSGPVALNGSGVDSTPSFAGPVGNPTQSDSSLMHLNDHDVTQISNRRMAARQSPGGGTGQRPVTLGHTLSTIHSGTSSSRAPWGVIGGAVAALLVLAVVAGALGRNNDERPLARNGERSGDPAANAPGSIDGDSGLPGNGTGETDTTNGQTPFDPMANTWELPDGHQPRDPQRPNWNSGNDPDPDSHGGQVGHTDMHPDRNNPPRHPGTNSLSPDLQPAGPDGTDSLEAHKLHQLRSRMQGFVNMLDQGCTPQGLADFVDAEMIASRLQELARSNPQLAGLATMGVVAALHRWSSFMEFWHSPRMTDVQAQGDTGTAWMVADTPRMDGDRLRTRWVWRGEGRDGRWYFLPPYHQLGGPDGDGPGMGPPGGPHGDGPPGGGPSGRGGRRSR